MAWKVRPIIEAFRKGALRPLRPAELCIDEQMIPFSGKCKMKQFVRGNPNPVGLKDFILADKNGIVYDLYLYQETRI